MVVKIDGRQLQHLRFADDIVLITLSISQAERMLADFDRLCESVGLQLNLTKTMFMRNGQVPDVPFSLSGTNISECFSNVYPEKDEERPTPCPPIRLHSVPLAGRQPPLSGVTHRFRRSPPAAGPEVRGGLYASETWAIRNQEEHAISVAQRGIERTMVGVNTTYASE
ncbi:unnamed protein product [Heligmosomoides polygyrus]|uniref:Reverse transcriptase domain-containing protein n=1 Tax=Heligmosomoides polygyrus TaxID=6339 RepID=A0A183FXX4_HELPZ|nr:unnamed protein product [Heligmosomoides polygyrus]